ncbi:MAG: hypothetical protein P9M03_06885 [Candidatus Theseobacter exili]|nr:hypothetical protein [Candidatus Theseobacter exili]
MNKDITQIAYSRVVTRDEFKDEFLRIFKVPLNKKFFENLTGFDVIAFDEFIQPKIDESSYEAINRRFGQEGEDLIKNLMKKELHNLLN